MNRHWLGWQSTTWWETMESWLEVSLYIFVFLESVLSSGCFYSSCFVFIVLSHQLIIVLTWVNLMGWAGRGQCTDLASWPLHKMYMLLLAVSVHVYPDLMLLSCIGWPYLMPNFPFYFSPTSDCWNFYHINDTIVTPFSNLRPNSFASTIVSQSEISTNKANPESKLVFTWENIFQQF